MSEFPDVIDNQGRWCVKDGKLYKSIVYSGGSARWTPEGTVMYSGMPGREANHVWRLKFTRFHRFLEWLRGGPLVAARERESESYRRLEK